MKPSFPYKRILTFLPVLALSMSVMQCSCSDTLASIFVSESDELRLGSEFDRQLRTEHQAEYPIYKANTAAKEEFQNYVVNTFNSVYAKVPASEKPSYPFQVAIVDDPSTVNAFAVPGGYVYIYTGIINKAQNESELAGVMGHEIAHITHHHYRDAMMKDAGMKILIDALVGEDAGQLTNAVAGMFASLADLKVSREHEADADDAGTKYLGDSGRNPSGIATLFERMPSSGVAWLSTHPASPDRVQSVNGEVSQLATSRSWDTSDSSKFQSRFEAARSKM